MRFSGAVKREITLPPAAPKLNVKVSLHSATQCMVVGIDTRGDVMGMSGVMAMSMEGKLVTQFLPSSQAFGEEVIYFDAVFRPKEETTPSTFPLLLVEEFRQGSLEQGVVFESLAPVE